MDQSGAMQRLSVIVGVTVFLKSYANALSVFIAREAFSSAQVHLRALLQRVQASKWLPSRPVQRFRTPKRLPRTAGAVFSSVQVAPERTRAVFPNAKVAAERASAAFTGAQVAPELACAAFYRVFTCFLEPSGSGSEAPRPPRRPNPL